MRHTALLLLLILAVASVAFACGSSESSKPTPSSSLDAYFAQLGDVGNQFLDSLVLQPQGVDTTAPIADQVDVYNTYASGLTSTISTARDQLRALTPPSEVADAHAALVASVENALAVAQSLQDQLGGINSSEELQRLSIANNPDLSAAYQQFQTACNALGAIAVQNNIDRQVRCQ